MPDSILINNLPCSKSYANRALVYNFVENLNLNFNNLSNSDDVLNTISAIKQFNNDASEISLGEGGTTIRFMLSALATFDREFKILVHPRFKLRPIDDLFNALRSLGATVTESSDEDTLCYLQGPLKLNQSIEISCGQTSQFASSLLLISDKIKLNVIPKDLKESISYFKLTKKVILDLNKNKTDIPIDMSSSVYFILYAVLNRDLTFGQILSKDPSQADNKVFDVLDIIGASYSFDSKGLTVLCSKELKCFDFDVSDCLDLSLGLVYLALFLNGTSIIRGIKNLRYKEVDRIMAIKDILNSVGASFCISEEFISIEGNTSKSDFILEPLPDHRVVMISALVLKSINKKLNYNNSCVNKSFPNFFKILDSV